MRFHKANMLKGSTRYSPISVFLFLTASFYCSAQHPAGQPAERADLQIECMGKTHNFDIEIEDGLTCVFRFSPAESRHCEKNGIPDVKIWNECFLPFQMRMTDHWKAEIELVVSEEIFEKTGRLSDTQQREWLTSMLMMFPVSPAFRRSGGNYEQTNAVVQYGVYKLTYLLPREKSVIFKLINRESEEEKRITIDFPSIGKREGSGPWDRLDGS